MDHMSRCRSKFWLLFCLFFICWYIALHNAKWYNFSSPAIVFTDLNTTAAVENRTAGADGEETNRDSVDGDIDWINDASQLRDLEKELDPILQEVKPKFTSQLTKRPCSGRYIYIHDLPARFNDEILRDCRSINKWQDMCPYIENNGLGQNLGNLQRVFSRSGWYSTNQFLLEVIFQRRMKQYDCLTNDPSKATAIYVPYYAGLDVSRYLFDHNTTSRDALSLDLAGWLRKRPEWKAMSGKNHFLVAGRVTWDFQREIDDDDAWGNKLMLLPEFKNMTILTIEKSPWHSNEFAIPYPTYFHPKNDDEIIEWQEKLKKQRRRLLYCFAGAPRPNREESIRGEIIDQCNASKQKCKLLACSDDNLKCHNPVNVMKLFQSSSFCLQPPGDSYTRRSTFDAILAGCIPVFFTPGSAYIQYLWHFPKEFEKYSVLINEEDVKGKNVSIEKVLSRIPRNTVSEMREEVIRLIPKVVYVNPRSKLEYFEDAFDLSIKGVVERMENLKRNPSSFDFDEKSSWKYFLFGNVQKNEWDHYFRNARNNKVKKGDTKVN